MNRDNSYHKPKLYRLGTVRELTFGPSGSGTESANNRVKNNERGSQSGDFNSLPPRSPRKPDSP